MHDDDIADAADGIRKAHRENPEDWNGHVPKAENWQLQFDDGSVVHRGNDLPSDFADKDEAVSVASSLSADYHTIINAVRTS